MKINKLSWLLALILLAVLVFLQKKAVFLEENTTQLVENEKGIKLRKLQGRKKGEAPYEVFEYLNTIKTGVHETKPAYAENYLFVEYEKALKNGKNARTEEDFVWKERGPGNVGGRTRAFARDPSDATGQTWLAAGVEGGIWKTTNKGNAWTKISPDLAVMSVCALAIAPSQTSVIYAGTGEMSSSRGFARGNGMYKSSDKGQTWQTLSSTVNKPEFTFVNRILVDPQNANVVVVSTIRGVFRSEDGGNTWEEGKILPENIYASRFAPLAGRYMSIVANHRNFNTQYVAIESYGVLRSTDGGKTWTDASAGLGFSERIELAVSLSNPQKIYASVNINTSSSKVYVSENEGRTWQELKERDSDINYLGGQGDYDNTIMVNPFNENEFFVGGVRLYRSTVSTQTTELANDFQLGRIYNNSFFLFQGVTGFTLWNGVLDGNTDKGLLKTIEIRFGKDKNQKAHRFLVPPNRSSGVPDAEYAYTDYVDVPFEVWDTKSNTQLMVSFRDQSRNGKFDVAVTNDTDFTGREYLYVHTLPYDATKPATSIATAGGNAVDRMYFMWLTRAEGTWNQSERPDALIQIFADKTIRRECVSKDVHTTNSDLHPDHHSLQFYTTATSNEQRYTIFNTNDGGIAYSEDGGTSFGEANVGYNTSQFYHVDKRPNAEQYVGGMQDNGVYISPSSIAPDRTTGYTEQRTTYRTGTSGQQVVFADGFSVVWHRGRPSEILATAQYGNITKTKSLGGTWQQANAGMSDFCQLTGNNSPCVNFSFFTRLANSKTLPDLVFIGGRNGVWRSTDFADSWSLVRMNSQWLYRRNQQDTATSVRSLQVAINDANPNIVWAGAGMTGGTNLHVSTDQGRTFRAVSNYLKPIGAISGLFTHPTEPNTAYALFSVAQNPKILRTKDLGQTWEDISGFGSGTSSSNGFPDVAVFSMIVFPKPVGKIWVGTEIGIFESNDDGRTWNLLKTPVPPITIWDMKLVDNQVVLATYGRGIWTADVPKEHHVVTSIADGLDAQNVNLYPNPATDRIWVELPNVAGKNYQLFLYNLEGKTVWEGRNTGGGKIEISISNLPKGLYQFYATTGKEHFRAKLVK